MNKKRWFPIALAMLTLGACSDDNLSDYENGQPQWNAEGQGYVTLALNLPTTPSVSRANDEFADGEASEYAVNDATLLIFTGSDESSATFHSAYELNLNNWNNETDDPNQITTATKITQLINNYDEDKVTAFALVVLNNNGKIVVDNNAGVTISGTKIEAPNNTWSAVQKAVLENSNLTNNGIMMVNATLTDKPGGKDDPTGGAIKTLVALDANKIYTTAAEAASGDPAASIYVERAVAKVKLTSSAASGALENNSTIKYEIDGWLLDITNKKTYLAHVAKADWLGYASAGVTDYRFAGNEPVEKGVALYRNYWAEDPNYSSFVAGDFTRVEDITDQTSFLALGGHAYCLENTFDVANMNENQSTRVIVRAKFNGGTTFYTLDQSTDQFYDKDGMEDLFKEKLLTNESFKAWTAENIQGGTGTVTGEKILLTFDAEDEAKGIMQVSAIAFTDDIKAQAGKTTVIPDTYVTLVNGLNVQKYTNGHSYYPAIIEHFGDKQTPWNTWEENAGADVPSNEDVYPGEDAEANYLGRYGVVRNNWYELNVSKVSKLGWPDVPPADGGSDDNMDAYISVEINILSWAKRTQDVEL